MTIFIGLGNPGEKYEQTRHNAGWMYLDYTIKQLGLENFSSQKKVFSEISKNQSLILAKPQTFMNDSGRAVQAILKWYGNSEQLTVNSGQKGFPNLFIVYDDLDIPLGKYKLQFGSGPKVHNGVNSIREHLGTDQFWNIRIGVDARNGDRSMSGSDYVLQKFNLQEKAVLKNVFSEIFTDLESKITQE